MKKLYTIKATQDMLDCLERNKPSGGWFKEICKNSSYFKRRTCKNDGKKYKAGERCPCFY